MKKTDIYLLTLFLTLICLSIFGIQRDIAIGQESISISSLSSSGCPQIQTDCFGEPPGCNSGFGIYDPTTCMCVCPEVGPKDQEGNKCLCPPGQYAFGNMCSTKLHGDCFPEYKPVCGCDGITYGNSCVASFLGIKKKTKGICNVLNPRPVACLSDGDCPPGICSGGKMYQKYSCLENMCNELNFFADPCLGKSSSGSVGNIILNKNFTGIWKARVPKPYSLPSSSSSGECIVCIQVVPQCLANQTLVPQSCTKCAHCVDVVPPSSSSSGSQLVTSTLLHINESFSGSKIITLKLCVKDGQLEGTIHQGRVIDNGTIISTDIISENEVNLTVEDKNKVSVVLNLKLLNGRKMTIAFGDGHIFEARKLSLFRSCSSEKSILNTKKQ